MIFNKDAKTIGVDFDGTIVEHAYPDIGSEMMFAFATLRELQNRGHRLILWTIREGKLLDEAVEYCRQNGVEFYAVNKSFPEEQFEQGITPRKLQCDLFIDDRNIGGFIGWSEVWQKLYPDGEKFEHIISHPDAHYNFKNKKKSFTQKLISLFSKE
jgi:GNAT superfamily N-acetyltransferase